MTLQMAAFGLCLLFALQRLPAAVRGENRGIFYALLLMAAAMGLSIPSLYLSVDAMLGGMNIANVIIRYCVFATLVILGTKIAAAFNAPRAQLLISGTPGLAVLGVAAAAVAALFILSDLPESSPALRAYWDQGTVSAYGEIARVYQAYVAACLTPALFMCAADPRRRADIRISAGLMSLGMCIVVIHTLLSLAVWNLPRGAWDRVLPYTAVIVTAAGLAIIWNSQRRAKKQREAGPLSRVNHTR